MTIRQLYYTSCQHGRDGGQGFQINAASGGLIEQHEDAGLRLSAYRPSPSAPVVPTAEQIERFPVAVGYRSFGDVAVLFHSRYLGADFTGRQGNYFAHILVLDAPERDLDAMLPIEAWGSALWRWRPAQDTRLPLIESIPPGPLADIERIRTHLLQDRLPEFGVLLTAVQSGLSGRTKRVVVVAPDAGDVAYALAAVTRSLPIPHARAMSFTTFTSSPSDADVLVAGTTPDVEVSAGPYGDQVVVRLAAGRSGDRAASRYASVLHDCWDRGSGPVLSAVELAAGVSPQLQPAELDQFADLVELVVLGSPGARRDPLPAVEFALRRLPSVLTPQLWQRLDEHTVAGASVDHLNRWSEVFTEANRTGREPGRKLETAYVQAALTRIAEGLLEPAGIWLPAQTAGRRRQTVLDWAVGALKTTPQISTVTSVLDTLSRLGIRLSADTELHSQVVEVVLAELLNPNVSDAPTRLRQLPDAARLLPQACDQLERRLEPVELFDTVVAELLSPESAELLASHAPPGSRCALAAALTLARARQTGQVSALLQVAGRPPRPHEVERFAALLWTQLPTAKDGVQLCRGLDNTVLAATWLPEQLLARLIEDARGPGLGADDEELADLLAAHPIAGRLGDDVATAVCIRWGSHFKNNDSRVSRNAEQEALDAVRYATSAAPPEVATWTQNAVTGWMLSLTETARHGQILLRVLKESGSPDFLAVYSEQLAEKLISAKPPVIARILPAVVFVAHYHQNSFRWLNNACKGALRGRRKRDLDAIGRCLEKDERKIESLLPKSGKRGTKSWPTWWAEWRAINLPQSTLGRLMGRFRSGGDD